jgi:hypothetical protein
MPTTAGSAVLWWKGKKAPSVVKIDFDHQPRSISFSRIDWADAAYRITYHRPLEPLIRSIETIGLQQAPLLQEKEAGRFCIVAGYRRLQALQKIKPGLVSCHIAAFESEKKDLFLFNFFQNMDRGFNAVEVPLAVIKLSSFLEEKELIDKYLPLLNLPPLRESIERCLRINRLSPAFLPALLQGRLFPETVETVDRDFSPLAHLVFALFIFLHWGFQKQKEFLSELKEICIRRGEEPENFLSTFPIADLLRRSPWTPQQKGGALRKYFRNCLYPILTATEKRFEEIVSQSSLDPRTRIHPPPFFEGGIYSLDIRFSSPKELKGSLERIHQALEGGRLDGLP